MEGNREKFRVIDGGRTTEDAEHRKIADNIDTRIEATVALEETGNAHPESNRKYGEYVSSLIRDFVAAGDVKTLEFLFHHCNDRASTLHREREREGRRRMTNPEMVRESRYALIAQRIAKVLVNELDYPEEANADIAAFVQASRAYAEHLAARDVERTQE